MRRLLLALPFTLLPLAAGAAAPSHEHAHEHAEHGSLDVHEHGAALLNVVFEGKVLELQLESPAMNLVGFEHAPQSDTDKAKLATTRSQLQQPQALFGLSAGDCRASLQELTSPLFEENQHAEHHAHNKDSQHSDIHAHYRLDCQKPDELQQLDLRELFKRFPATEKIQVQLIGPRGQQGLELTPAQPTLSF
jgi:hypothetical protein